MREESESRAGLVFEVKVGEMERVGVNVDVYLLLRNFVLGWGFLYLHIPLVHRLGGFWLFHNRLNRLGEVDRLVKN